MNIDEMEAGRELDMLIAEKVMGWQVIRFSDGRFAIVGRYPDEDDVFAWAVNPDDDDWYIIWQPSKDMRDAWRVVEKLNKMKPGWFSLEQFGEKGQHRWRALIWSGDEEGSDCWFADATTVPLAICRAALKAVGADKE